MEITIGVLVSLILTILILSFVLYKDNIAFRFAQLTFIGVSLGNIFVIGVINMYNLGLKPLFEGKLILLIPVLLGIMLYTFYTKYSFLYRWSMGVLLGVGTALGIRGWIQTRFWNAIVATARPIFAKGTPLQMLNNWLMPILVCAGLYYFTFGHERKSAPSRGFSRLGKTLILAEFGAMFASLTYSNLTSIASRIRYIIDVIQSII